MSNTGDLFCAMSTSSFTFSSGASAFTLKVTLIFSYPFLTLSDIPSNPWISRSPDKVDSTSSIFIPWAAAWYTNVVVRQPFNAASAYYTGLAP